MGGYPRLKNGHSSKDVCAEQDTGYTIIQDKLCRKHGIMDFGETISERKIEITCLIPRDSMPIQLLDKRGQHCRMAESDKGLWTGTGRSRTGLL